ncbi:radical SAM protein [Desulfovibrio inopinatus]|uniref:radical SAM protein n=1 Tax=Desulfovibrio inopinatus TaxID=102109 RepID=UPI0003FBBC85|nr:radical SAM protein [Desulfovibrio inopinatus]
MLREENEQTPERKAAFDQAMAEARYYVENPDALRKEVDTWEKERDQTHLYAPHPDQYAYRMMNYRGFVRFPERLWNFLIVKENLRDEHCISLPVMMDIEPDSRCNFRCIMCARAKEGVKAKGSPRLKLEDFKKFMDANPQFVEVKVQGVGEPLLNPDIFDMISYAISRDTWVRTTVNGSLLHKNENYKRLIDSGIGEVQTSFDGTTKETFERIRVGSDFDRIVANLKLMNDYAAKMDRDYTRMWVLLQNNNRSELLDFITLAAKMGFRRLTYSVVLTGWGEEDCFDNLKTKAFSDEEEGKILEKARKEGIDVSVWNCTDRFRVDSPETVCPVPFTRAFIASDLRIIPCGTIGYSQDVNYGQALDFKKHWNSKIYRAFRRAHLTGNIPAFCRECYDLDNVPTKDSEG